METLSRSDARENGKYRFFTGIPCKSGHVSYRNVSDNSCVECKARNRRKYAIESPEKLRIRKGRYKANHPDKYSAQARGQVSRWRAKFPHKVNALAAKHRALKLLRTPAWADLNYICEIYRCAASKKDEKGRTFHVDHVLPLNGKTVSGLHVAENLRIAAPIDNLKKSNKVLALPDMHRGAAA